MHILVWIRIQKITMIYGRIIYEKITVQQHYENLVICEISQLKALSHGKYWFSAGGLSVSM